MIKTIVFALVVLVMIAGLALVPALTEQTADAKSCEDKKPKKPRGGDVNAVMPEPSITQVKCGDGGGGINVGCDGFKKNGDVCKPKKLKDNV